jgi:hypothetical protein
MSIRTPSSNGLSVAPNAAATANDPAASPQEVQQPWFWGRWALNTQLPNVGTVDGSGVTGVNPAAAAAYDKMRPGDMALVGTQPYWLVTRGTVGGNNASWQSYAPGGSGITGGPGTDNAIVRWDGTGTMVVQNSTVIVTDAGTIQGASGAAGTPTYTFSGDVLTGIFRPASGALGVTTSGTERWRFTGAQLLAQGAGQIGQGTANTQLGIRSNITSVSTIGIELTNGTSGAQQWTGSGAQTALAQTYTLLQTGAGAFTAHRINLTQSSIGSGTYYFHDYQIGNVTVAAITAGTDAGRALMSIGSVTAPGYGWIGRAGGLYSINTLSTALTMDTSASSIGFTRVSGHNYVIENLGSAGSLTIRAGSVGSAVGLSSRFSTTTGTFGVNIDQVASTAFSAASGAQGHVAITSVINQAASTAGFTQLQLAQTQTSLGSGDQRFVSMRIGGAEVAAIEGNGTLQAGRYMGPAGTNDFPTFSFLTENATGIYLSDTEEMSMTFLNNQTIVFNSTGGIYPVADNTIPLGGAANRWTTLWSQTLNTGDVVMRDPKPEGKKLDEIAHWALVEELDGIAAYNVRTNEKFSIALKKSKRLTQRDRTKLTELRGQYTAEAA